MYRYSGGTFEIYFIHAKGFSSGLQFGKVNQKIELNNSIGLLDNNANFIKLINTYTAFKRVK